MRRLAVDLGSGGPAVYDTWAGIYEFEFDKFMILWGLVLTGSAPGEGISCAVMLAVAAAFMMPERFLRRVLRCLAGGE